MIQGTASRNGKHAPIGASIIDLLSERVIPALSPDDVFRWSGHNWHRDRDKWRGACPWHDSKSGTSFYINPATMQWRCGACDIGGGPLQYIDRLDGGNGTLRGKRFVDVARLLFLKAGIDFPDTQSSSETHHRAEIFENYRATLEAIASICQRHLRTCGDAMEYLVERRGIPAEAVEAFRMGFWPNNSVVMEELEATGVIVPKWLRHNPLGERPSTNFAGHVLIPWLDERGQHLTAYVAWPGTRDGQHAAHKKCFPNLKRNGEVIVPGKRSPLFLDRALQAGHRDVVVVEGVFDAAVAQAMGDTRVVACVAAQFSGAQVETLKKVGVQSVTIALDPDAAGVAGVSSCVRSCESSGIHTYVAPTLPDGQDPDDFILSNDIQVWREHLEQARGGLTWIAEHAMGAITPQAPEKQRQQAARAACKELVRIRNADPLAMRDAYKHIARSTGYDVTDLRGGQDAELHEATEPMRFTWLDCEELYHGDFTIEYWIDRMLAKGQPCIIGGPKKCMKTSVMVDLAISVASGGKFLGYLPVNQRARVAFMCGESGKATLRETAVRVASKAGLALRDLKDWILWTDALPKLNNDIHLNALADSLDEHKPELLLIDPAYLCMPSADAGNLMAQGELLRAIGSVCEERKITLLLAHHARKNGKQDPHAPLELEDLAWAGFQEWARQWILVNRRERYEPGTGLHKLWLSSGGSAGHSGLWAVDIDEGEFVPGLQRQWDVSVHTASDIREVSQKEAADRRRQREAEKEAEKAAIWRESIDQIRRQVVAKLRKYPDGETKTTIREAIGGSKERFSAAWDELLDAGLIAECIVTKSGRKRSGCKLVESNENN